MKGIDLDDFCLVFHKHPVREMLKDVFPTIEENLHSVFVEVKVKHLKESMLSTMSFCAADKIVRLIKANKLSRTSLFGYFKGKLVLEKTFEIVPEGNII